MMYPALVVPENDSSVSILPMGWQHWYLRVDVVCSRDRVLCL